MPKGGYLGVGCRAAEPPSRRVGFPRMRPTLNRIPVPTRVTTRLDRPYEMNGRVSPVVGMRPSVTATCRTR